MSASNPLPASAAPALQLDSVSVAILDRTIVNRVSCLVEAGELFFLLGPSGCGKTTLLRAIAGFQQVSSGTILIAGKNSTSLPPQQRGVGMVFQQYALWPHMTVSENVLFGLEVRKLPRAGREKKARAILELLQLEELGGRYPSQLSGGQQQRVALARALVLEPSLILLDEPLANLDARLKETVRAEIKRIQRELGVTMVYVTHDQEEALSLGTTIAIMQSGAIVQTGSPRELYERPATAEVARFLGSSANIFSGTVSGDGTRIHIGGLSLEMSPSRTLAGRTIECMIRPERWMIREAGPGIEAVVRERAYFGASESLECFNSDLGELTVRRPLNGARPVGEGEKLYLSAPPDAVHPLGTAS